MEAADFGIDVDGKHKYVWTNHENGPILYGYEATVPYGWMTDGATCVKDLKVRNFMWHDWGYTVNEFIKDGKLVKLSKAKMDWLYAKASGKVSWWRRGTRFFGLALFPPTAVPSFVMWRKAKKRIRKMGTDAVVERDMIPHMNLWELPTNKTEDAIWLGHCGSQTCTAEAMQD